MNQLNIGNGNCMEVEKKLKIQDEKGFYSFINKVRELETVRSLAGFCVYKDFPFIADTLCNFDEITYDSFLGSYMEIDNVEKLNGDRWILRGMIDVVSKAIDENHQYGCTSPDHEFLNNLRDFLCLCSIRISH